MRRAEARAFAKQVSRELFAERSGVAGGGEGHGGTAGSRVEQPASREVNGPDLVVPMREAFATGAEVGQLLRVHAKTVERWRKTLGLPCLRLGGLVRYDLSDVLRWASARKEGA